MGILLRINMTLNNYPGTRNINQGCCRQIRMLVTNKTKVLALVLRRSVHITIGLYLIKSLIPRVKN